MCRYGRPRASPSIVASRSMTHEMAKTKYLFLCGWERRPCVSPRMCRGMRDVALYSIVDPMAGPALAPITTMIYVGCGRKATRGLVQRCVVRIWILLHTTAHRTAGPKQAWGRATAFSWLRLGRKPWASTLMYRRHPDLAVLHRRLGEAPTLA